MAEIKKAAEFKGEETLFAVKINELVRPFNQTDGSSTLSADEIELSTKDKTGSDYGAVTEELSFEGILTQGDVFIDFVKNAMRNKQFVEIVKINTRTMEAESGNYMVTSFEETFTNEEFAGYSLDAKLNGAIETVEVSELPEGAPGSNVNVEGGETEGTD